VEGGGEEEEECEGEMHGSGGSDQYSVFSIQYSVFRGLVERWRSFGFLACAWGLGRHAER
jgi:hypothetical protein